MSMYTVYYLDQNPIRSNSHGVCREESWEFRKEPKIFTTRMQAEKYVINKNLYSSLVDLSLNSFNITDYIVNLAISLPNFSEDLSSIRAVNPDDLQTAKFVRERCLDGISYMTKRKYHLIPDKELPEEFKEEFLRQLQQRGDFNVVYK